MTSKDGVHFKPVTFDEFLTLINCSSIGSLWKGMQLFAIDLAGPWYLDQVQTEVLRFGDNEGHVNESWEDFKQFWPLKNHVTRHDGMIGFNLGKVSKPTFDMVRR